MHSGGQGEAPMPPLFQQIHLQTDDNDGDARLGHALDCLMPLGMLALEPACLPSAHQRADVENDAGSLPFLERETRRCSRPSEILYLLYEALQDTMYIWQPH